MPRQAAHGEIDDVASMRAVAGWFARFPVKTTVLEDALPGGLELGVDDSRSYAQWLCQRPQALGLSPEPDDQ
jgi:hypothetical protein